MTAEDNASGYRYGFNGKEQDFAWKQQDGTIYDYGARVYEPLTSRWMSADPSRSMYPSTSPYHFAGNNPINLRDPDGKVVVDANGNIVYSSEGKFEPLKDQPKNYSENERLVGKKVEIYANDGTAITAYEIKKENLVYKQKMTELDGHNVVITVAEWENDNDENQSYDCHGYTFVKGNFWIQSHQVDELLEHDGYYQKPNISPEDAEGGNISLYCNDSYDPYNNEKNSNYSHSGVLNQDGTIKSKWGRNELKNTSNEEVEGRYGPRSEIYSKIPDAKLSKDKLKPAKTESQTRKLSDKEKIRLQNQGIIKK